MNASLLSMGLVLLLVVACAPSQESVPSPNERMFAMVGAAEGDACLSFCLRNLSTFNAFKTDACAVYSRVRDYAFPCTCTDTRTNTTVETLLPCVDAGGFFPPGGLSP